MTVNLVQMVRINHDGKSPAFTLNIHLAERFVMVGHHLSGWVARSSGAKREGTERLHLFVPKMWIFKIQIVDPATNPRTPLFHRDF